MCVCVPPPPSPPGHCSDALASAPKAGTAGRVIPPNKKTYQQDPANFREVLAVCAVLRVVVVCAAGGGRAAAAVGAGSGGRQLI